MIFLVKFDKSSDRFTHTLAFVIQVRWLVHKWTGPPLFLRNFFTLSPGSDVDVIFSSGMYTWSRWKTPSSRLRAAAPTLLKIAKSKPITGFVKLNHKICLQSYKMKLFTNFCDSYRISNFWTHFFRTLCTDFTHMCPTWHITSKYWFNFCYQHLCLKKSWGMRMWIGSLNL